MGSRLLRQWLRQPLTNVNVRFIYKPRTGDKIRFPWEFDRVVATGGVMFKWQLINARLDAVEELLALRRHIPELIRLLQDCFGKVLYDLVQR